MQNIFDSQNGQSEMRNQSVIKKIDEKFETRNKTKCKFKKRWSTLDQIEIFNSPGDEKSYLLKQIDEESKIS